MESFISLTYMIHEIDLQLLCIKCASNLEPNTKLLTSVPVLVQRGQTYSHPILEKLPLLLTGQNYAGYVNML